MPLRALFLVKYEFLRYCSNFLGCPEINENYCFRLQEKLSEYQGIKEHCQELEREYKEVLDEVQQTRKEEVCLVDR